MTNKIQKSKKIIDCTHRVESEDARLRRLIKKFKKTAYIVPAQDDSDRLKNETGQTQP